MFLTKKFFVSTLFLACCISSSSYAIVNPYVIRFIGNYTFLLPFGACFFSDEVEKNRKAFLEKEIERPYTDAVYNTVIVDNRFLMKSVPVLLPVGGVLSLYAHHRLLKASPNILGKFKISVKCGISIPVHGAFMAAGYYLKLLAVHKDAIGERGLNKECLEAANKKIQEEK